MATELTYNGYTFPPYANITAQLTFVYDDANRSIIEHQWVITARATILRGDYASTQAHMDDIRMRLSEPAKTLEVKDIGLGQDLTINSSGATWDVAWGPKPKVLQWTPIGHKDAVEVVWTVQVSLSPCTQDMLSTYQGLKSANFSVGFAINRNGWTSRTVIGHLLVAQTDHGTDTPFSADQFRHLVTVAHPDNCHREQTYNVSADKSRLDFSIVDTEIESPTAYPPGVINIAARQRVSSARPWQRSNTTLHVTITLAVGQPKTRAWAIFTTLVEHTAGIVLAQLTANEAVFYERLDIDEAFFTYESQYSFSLQWRFIGDLASLLSKNFLFQTLGYNWAEWAQSVARVHDRRGNSQMSHLPQYDTLTTLCTQDPIDLASHPDLLPAPAPDTLALCNPLPDPAKSYLMAESSLTELVDYNSHRDTTLGTTELDRYEWDHEETTRLVQGYSSAQYEQVFASTPIRQRFQWRGAVMRAGYEVPRPDKIRIGGRKATPVGQGVFEQRFLGWMFCQPVYLAVWNLVYETTEAPDDSVIENAEIIPA